MPNVYPQLDHYNYPKLDVECACSICMTWRGLRNEFDQMKRLTLTHDRSCMCWRCCRRRSLQSSFLAAAAKRELFCEMSFHAARHPSYGDKLMNWVSLELAQNSETDGWWATLAQAYSLTFWFSRFQDSVHPGMRPTAQLVNGHKPAEQWWCGWCGEDLPDGRTGYCSDDCSADNQAFLAQNQRRPRRRLIETAFGWVVSGAISMRTSGVAA